jgi:hypothetical protein
MSTSKHAPRRAHALIAGAAGLLAAMASPAAALAQDKPPQHYQVEVVIFLQPARTSAERPPLPAMPAVNGILVEGDEPPDDRANA